MGFEHDYYDQPELWGKDFSEIPAERERINATIELIPLDVKTNLDVGCGNGAFLHALPSNYEAIGIDASREALRHVKVKTVHGNIECLPFPDESFDLVTCLEVLEHLPVKTFEKALFELQRVSKKYIIISVPNRENIEQSLVMCPKCYCWYNPHRHVRSFNHEIMKTLFTQFTLATLKEIGPVEPRSSYNRIILGAYKLWKRTLPPATAVCPQCGYQLKTHSESPKNVSETKQTSHLISIVKPIARTIWRPLSIPRWLLALYVKKESENG
ncbi:class I SAM-dependent methyltransferase [Thermodesulfovibrio hydrogeniphilus]